MNVSEFRDKISLDKKLIVGDREFSFKEIIKFRFDDGGFYIKCFLSDGYVLADDLNENNFILVKEIKTSFSQPFPEKVEFDGKEFEFLYSAHAIAEEIRGEEIFKKGESETFWDYKSADGSYLSLGIIDRTGKRLDFYGKTIEGGEVDLK